MSNIESLNLHFTIDNQTTFIDGEHIYNEIIVHMSQLQTFNFCFCTFIQLDYLVHHLSKDDILQTFSNIMCQQVDCMINYRRYDVKYHVFSLPLLFDYLPFIDNIFPNIIFNHVIRLIVDDEIPFKHEFFMRIAWSFPLLKELHVFNLMPQSSISNKLNSNDNQLHSTIIEYPYEGKIASDEHCFISDHDTVKKIFCLDHHDRWNPTTQQIQRNKEHLCMDTDGNNLKLEKCYTEKKSQKWI
ncbi:unnamed protein product [Rotaria sp. Silwood2]|nr:unnamed protein product [Rotaria sp. Silwood2]